MAHLIDKSALVAEIKRKIHNIDYEGLSDRNIGQKQSLYHILSFLDTLEVKALDLKKEIYDAEKKFGDIDEMGGYRILLFDDEFRDVLRYFFELGLNAKDK